jgi:uncharacterized OB-fold protein
VVKPGDPPAVDMTTKAAPVPTPETQPYWDGCAAGELRLQRCTHCDAFYFPPRPFCPDCLSGEVVWEALSGRGTLHTYVINHRAAPGFEAPYAIAVVQLDEGPRLMSNIVGVPQTPEALELDMALEVAFEGRGDIQVPVFRPAGSAS